MPAELVHNEREDHRRSRRQGTEEALESDTYKLIQEAWGEQGEEASELLPYLRDLMDDYDLCVVTFSGDVHHAFQCGVALGYADAAATV